MPSPSERQLKALINQARKYQLDIQSNQDSLLYVYDMLSSNETIRPDQCRRAVVHLDTLESPVEQLCTLIEQIAGLQATNNLLEFPLLIKLYYFHEQLDIVVLLLKKLEISAQTPSSQADKHFRVIESKLKVLLDSLGEILQETIWFGDRSIFAKAYTQAA